MLTNPRIATLRNAEDRQMAARERMARTAARQTRTTCGTVGCKSPAEYEISYNYRGEDEVTTDLACGPCADGYAHRPVLKNFKRTEVDPRDLASRDAFEQ